MVKHQYDISVTATKITNNGKTDNQFDIPVTATNCDQIFRIKFMYFLLNDFFYLFNFMPWNSFFKIFEISVIRVTESGIIWNYASTLKILCTH